MQTSYQSVPNSDELTVPVPDAPFWRSKRVLIAGGACLLLVLGVVLVSQSQLVMVTAPQLDARVDLEDSVSQASLSGQLANRNRPCGSTWKAEVVPQTFPDPIMSPEWVLLCSSKSLRSGCTRHDDCYDGVFGCDVSKSECDHELGNRWREICDDGGSYSCKKACKAQVEAMYAIMERASCDAFNDARAKECKNPTSFPVVGAPQSWLDRAPEDFMWDIDSQNRLINKATDFALDVTYATDDESNRRHFRVNVQAPAGSDAQKWQVKEFPDTQPGVEILNRRETKCLDLDDGAEKDTAIDAVIRKCSDGGWQRWDQLPAHGTWFYLRNRSGKTFLGINTAVQKHCG